VSLRLELIPETLDGEEELRLARIDFELLPEAGHVDVYRSGECRGVVPPDAGQQVLARERLARILDKEPEELELACS
jgi:hypothetical protein